MFWKKKKEITIQDNVVSIMSVEGEDYISLTDMVRSKEGEFFVKDWLRNRNTLEFLAVWEQMHNPSFNIDGFRPLAESSGLNSFKLSVKEWIEQTSAKGIIAKAGRYGGTYAHRDIAFEFGTWISPVFKLYLIKEYQRLKEIDTNQHNLEWNVKRMVSKANYRLHTDAVKEHVIPHSRKWIKEWEYAEEADILNVSVFGCTAKEWRKSNPERDKNNENIRDSASINELIVLSNIEAMNTEMMRDRLDKKTRFEKLSSIASRQLETLNKMDFMGSIKKTSPEVYFIESQKEGKK
ncbi:MAG: KilA-N domain-containing protein [Holosporales bacterium]|jgi:hypothetical protein